MWPATFITILALSAGDPLRPDTAAKSPSNASSQNFVAPAPIYCRQTRFSIPFHIDRPENANREPVEVKLFVSGDHGVHWQYYFSVKPSAGNIPFRAGNDGECWFDVHTVDRAGQERPGGPYAPRLIVIVDTTPPKIKLEARRGDAGQVTAKLNIEEAYPKLDTLSLDYRGGAVAAWQKVPIASSDIHAVGDLYSAVLTWSPPSSAGALEIRAHMSDLAGNPAESRTEVAVTDAAVAARTNTPPVSPTPATSSISNPVGASSTSSNGQSLSGSRSVTSWPADNLPGNNGGMQVRMAAMGEDGLQGSVIAMRVNPAIRDQYVTPDERAAADTQSGAIVPPGISLRWVNLRAFELDYDADSLAHNGQLGVEIWGTRDGGRSWKNYGQDTRRKTPTMVTVDSDGVYGFRIAAMPNVGGRPAGSVAPQAGDAPQVWIGVDMTKPTGCITSVRQGIGHDTDKLFITWQAADNQKLAEHPIALAASETRGGPWTTVVAGLDNTGHFTWLLRGTTMARVYLRLEVRDEAGNIATFETPEPMAIDRTPPSPPPAIRGVESIGGR